MIWLCFGTYVRYIGLPTIKRTTCIWRMHVCNESLDRAGSASQVASDRVHKLNAREVDFDSCTGSFRHISSGWIPASFLSNRSILLIIYSIAWLVYLSTSFWMSSFVCFLFWHAWRTGFWEAGKAFDTTYTLYPSNEVDD